MLILSALALAISVSAQDASYSDRLVARSRELKLSEDPGWRALGHYSGTRFLRLLRSEIDGGEFFLSPEGRKNPQAELEATLKAFFIPVSEDPAKMQAQCAFPARYHWLKERLAFDPARLPEQDCPRFEKWRKAIDPGGVTLIYASAYLNNPSSMYGHTFMKLKRRGAGSGEELLDYTINYAGDPLSGNGFLYAIRGLTGGIKGQYSTLPYYMKVQEYTNMESRDLWEYDLNLSQEEVDQLLRHAWEVGQTYSDYYFFTANCSYELMTLLDAVRPELRLARDFHFSIVPGNTVRAVLKRPGLVSGERYRPSHVTQMKAGRARLSGKEASLAVKLISKKPPYDELNILRPERQALVLDSADDLLRFRAGFANEQSTATVEGERALFIARGRLGLPPMRPDIKPPHPLEDGHDTARLGFGGGASTNFGFEEFSWRGALHDVYSPDLGYLADSQLEMLNARLRFDNRDRVPYVERADIVNIMAISPWDPWLRKVSWKISTGVDQAKELGCGPVACMHYVLNAGFGLAAESHMGKRELYYAFAESDFGAAPVFSDGWRLGAGGTAGVAAEETDSLKTSLEATYIGYMNSPSRERLRLSQSWRLSKDVELRLNLDRRVPDQEAGLSVFYYY